MPKMKAYATFDLWAADQTLKHRKLIALLRKLVKKTAPRLTETVKWGNGCWVGTEWPVIYLYADCDHLQFGFFGGSGLKDPQGLLQGKGKHVRHTKIYTTKDIDAVAFARLIRQADQAERE